MTVYLSGSSLPVQTFAYLYPMAAFRGSVGVRVRGPDHEPAPGTAVAERYV